MRHTFQSLALVIAVAVGLLTSYQAFSPRTSDLLIAAACDPAVRRCD